VASGSHTLSDVSAQELQPIKPCLENDDVTEPVYHPEQQIDANGLRLNFDSFGDPAHPVMILVMGLATQMIFWDKKFCRHLAQQGYWVIRFDNRDIGKSTWLKTAKVPGALAFLSNIVFAKKMKAPYLLDDMANDTLALMDALTIAKAHVVGASMGGMIAQIMAIKAPQRVASLTSIMSTTGDRSLPKPNKATSLKLLGSPPREEQAFIKHGVDIWRILHGDHYPFEEERITHMLQKARARGVNPAGVSRQLAAILGSADRTSTLSALKMPCLVIHGDADPLVPVECGKATAKAIPHAQLKIYPGMGHTIPVEIAADIIQTIVSMTKAADE